MSDEQVPLYAVMGVGSNAVRLLIIRMGDGQVSTMERLETVTRLGAYRNAGSTREPVLDGDAMRATLSAADAFARHAHELGARMVGVVATEAVRAAANRDLLTGPLGANLGLPVTVLSGEEEVALGWQAVASWYDAAAPIGVIDIGGGSTGVSLGMGGAAEPEAAESMQMGARLLTQRYRLDRRVRERDLISVREVVAAEVAPRLQALRPAPKLAVVIGGTASVLAAVHPGLLDRANGNEAGAHIDRGWLATWLASVAGNDIEGRVRAGVHRELVDIIVAGGLILLTVLDAWGLEDFYVSQRNILDGFIIRRIAEGLG